MKYICPVCNTELTLVYGTGVHPGDREYGVTLYCNNPHCSSAEVFGHGNREIEAYSVISWRFGNKRA